MYRIRFIDQDRPKSSILADIDSGALVYTRKEARRFERHYMYEAHHQHHNEWCLMPWDECWAPHLHVDKKVLVKDARYFCKRVKRATRPATVNPSQAVKTLPRGLQILAFETDNLTLGFPYPRALKKLGIWKEHWYCFVRDIIPPLQNTFRHTIAKHIETILDRVAEQDVALFRPKGLIMRMDMPGEQKFGLDFMDLYHSGFLGLNHVDNLSGAGTTDADYEERRNLGAIPFNFKASKSHLYHLRREFYEGTRIVIDPLTILDDPEAAYKRGWTNWIEQCKKAKEAEPRDEVNPRPSWIQELVWTASKHRFQTPIDDGAYDHYEVARNGPYVDIFDNYPELKVLEDYCETLRQRPISERVFRWPPSKQLYYDRWRGHTASQWDFKRGGHIAQLDWLPYEDSMDKRMRTQWYRLCVVPADEIEVTVMEEGGLEDQCLKTHRHMSAEKVVGKEGPLYPGRPRRRPIPTNALRVLKSEHLYAYTETQKVYVRECEKLIDLVHEMMRTHGGGHSI
jgi:hypothetical protein